jgi:hypothetical protein
LRDNARSAFEYVLKELDTADAKSCGRGGPSASLNGGTDPSERIGEQQLWVRYRVA